MDLGTIRQKIDEGVYLKKEEAVEDLMQVWENAMTFNLPDHPIHQVRPPSSMLSMSRASCV